MAIMSGLLLTFANALVLVAMLVFASGFFPYKPFLPGHADYKSLAGMTPPEAPFDKVIFMVVDALRSDFVFSEPSGFAFTQSLVADGAAIPFTAYARAPTVTMPRLKALTTGSIPSFLDMILNLAESDTTSSLASQDTWLAQMKRKPNGRLVMYGDDTWVKLFPNTFDRVDGTTSFFVSDFTEVDNNVTRHIPDELQRTDWNVMIMHFLGMDHIGHKAGPRSVNMLPKQREMDDIVRQIYTAMMSYPHLDSTLFVLCGDHGMNDGGNHGGSAPGETSPALVFAAPKMTSVFPGVPCPVASREEFDFYETIEQSDIAPTLAGLLGFPVPLNNLGVFIDKFLSMWKDDGDRIQLLQRNALQLLDIVKATFPHALYDEATANVHCDDPSTNERLACEWKSILDSTQGTADTLGDNTSAASALKRFCRDAQSSLSSTASNYDLTRLQAGIAIAVTACVIALALAWLLTDSARAEICHVGLALSFAAMMFASSYVEEEQQFWYWLTSAWVAGQIFSRTMQFEACFVIWVHRARLCFVMLRQ